ncbi:hypothetical protein HU200_022097 [Digitaria exilis]|uniref:Uncharacterized protein n=1 Tax=Digitaria exilis TaxID=1010633 RepID=A0A835C8I3_9POAL|nr:hypothetical protein HU200_022097 [Digitaria exilis]
MEDEAMDLELLWTGPTNEEYLDECIGVTDHCSPQMENQFHSLNVKDGEAEFEETNIGDLDIEDYIDHSMTGCFFPNDRLGHGKRGPRSTSRSARVVHCTHILGLQEPSRSGGTKHIARKNNDHWTQDEVRELVNGVSEFGVGKWKNVKIKYFLTSIRTPVNLKDKWKNLVKACKKDSGRMLLPLEQSLIQRIMEIDHNDPYPKQSNDSALDRLAPFAPNLPLVLQQPPSLTARWSVVKTRTKRDSMHTLKNSNKNTPRGPSSFRIGTNETN